LLLTKFKMAEGGKKTNLKKSNDVSFSWLNKICLVLKNPIQSNLFGSHIDLLQPSETRRNPMKPGKTAYQTHPQDSNKASHIPGTHWDQIEAGQL